MAANQLHRKWGAPHVPKGMAAPPSRKGDEGDDESWKVIARGLRAVEGNGQLSFDEVYRQVVYLVDRGKGGWLYERVTALVGKTVEDAMQELAKESTLEEVVEVLEHIEKFSNKARNLTSYLEIHWITRRGADRVDTICKHAISKHVITASTPLGMALQKRLSDCFSTPLPSQIPPHLACLVRTASTLPSESYARFFETPLLQSWFPPCFEAVQKRLETCMGVGEMSTEAVEAWRGFDCLLSRLATPQHTEAAAQRLYVESLFGASLSPPVPLLSSLLRFLSESSWDVEELKMLVELAKNHGDRATLLLIAAGKAREGLGKKFQRALVQELEGGGEEEVVLLLVGMRAAFRTLDDVLPTGAPGDEEETVVHRHSKAVTRILARYLDKSVRVHLLSESELPSSSKPFLAAWANLRILYPLIDQKDTLQEMYCRHLARRLFFRDRSALMAEQQVLASFKMLEGAAHSPVLRRCEEMLKDAHNSVDQVERFRAEGGPREGFFLVVREASWPVFPCAGGGSPSVSERFLGPLSQFAKTYLDAHTGRRLQWRHDLGNAVLTYHSTSRRKHDVTCGILEASILLNLFDEKQGDGEVAERAAAVEPSAALHNLLTSKLLVPVAGAKNMYSFNGSPRLPRRVVVHKQRNDEVAAEPTVEVLRSERSSASDAALIRVMKSRRRLPFAELLSLTAAQLMHRFKPEVAFLKKRVETLVVKDYLARDEVEPNVILYVA